MRPRLLHPLSEGRHSRRHRRRRGAPLDDRNVLTEPVGEDAIEPVLAPRIAYADPDVLRVQSAGGPTDHASYSCSCGYLFSADVSTSVTCPHCGAGQAW
jgi:hypothetical protein